MIIAIAFLIRWVLHFVIDRVVNRIVSGVKKKQDVTDTQALQASPLAAVRVVQRTRTLGSRAAQHRERDALHHRDAHDRERHRPRRSSARSRCSTAAIGAGLGFGAQNIVKDVLNGLFMVVEDQLGVGDVVDLGPATGIVEEVQIRITKVRDVNGTLWFVRNGEILRVGNMSQGWARVILDLAVPYDADVDAVEAEMLRTAVEMSQTGKWRSRVLEKPEIWGLESISDEAIVIRIVMKVRTSAKDDVARELRMRLKRAARRDGRASCRASRASCSPASRARPACGARSRRRPRRARSSTDAAGSRREDRPPSAPKRPDRRPPSTADARDPS